MRRRIGITLGDPAGIGPEIVRAALAGGKLPEADYRLIGETAAHSFGKPTPESAHAARAALEEAARLALAGEIDAGCHRPDSQSRHVSDRLRISRPD
jgi:4-hydroxythreonine-4-phosphate dehydrogenase